MESLDVVLQDLHAPFEDSSILQPIMDCCKDIKPNSVILNGDIADFHSIGKYDVLVGDWDNFQQELDAISLMLSSLRADIDPEMFFICGNHEDRTSKFLMRSARPMARLRYFDMDSLLSLKEIGIRYVDDCYKKVGSILVTHGTCTGYNAAMSELTKWMCSGISGHNHKINMVTRPTPDGRNYTWLSCGHLTDKDKMKYATTHSWNQSFAIVHTINGISKIMNVMCDDLGFYCPVNGKQYFRFPRP